jgi:cytochrome c5
MNKIKLLAAVILATVLYSCATKKAVETPAPATTSVMASLSPEMQEGKTLYENNCAKCHKLFSPSERTKEEWGPIIAKMQQKAKIDDIQTAKIYNYLTYNLK